MKLSRSCGNNFHRDCDGTDVRGKRCDCSCHVPSLLEEDHPEAGYRPEEDM